MKIKTPHLIPDFIINPIILLRRFTQSIYYRGTDKQCPICEKTSRKFLPFGIVQRNDAKCYWCGSLERHRFVWLYFDKITNLFDRTSKKVLHIAPEPCIEVSLKKRFGVDQEYITADLLDPRAMVKMDVTEIQYPDGFFDVIYCSHVLEHVLDDLKAMREFYRILKQQGWAILLVPITEEITFEDSSIVEPSERLRVFGQKDHVRRYGRDYIDRLRVAGFIVKKSSVNDLFAKEDIVRFGLTSASGEIYFCSKE